MNLQRILNMKPSELAFRGRQQAYKTLERLTAPGGETSPSCQYGYNDGGDPELLRLIACFQSDRNVRTGKQLKQRFQELAAQRFFSGAGEIGIELAIGADHPRTRAQIIASADAVCAEKFAILGYGDLAFGSPPNWQCEPVAGVEATPSLHWSKIKPLMKNQVGDSKVVWELNRHQWLLDLGQAWRFTGEARYAQAAVRLLRDWMNKNPPGFGINWSSSLEVAFRLISWSWALLLLRGSAALTPVLLLEMLGWVQAHARYTERYLSRYFSPNTHLTGEALGLFYAGTLFPELQGARRWREQGAEILVEQMPRQVHADGVYFEQSTRYQYYTVEIYQHFMLLAERNRIDVPTSVRDRLSRMVFFLLAMRNPDGNVQQVGDADGGWLLPLVRRPPEDHRSVFSTAAVMFRNSQFAWAAGELAPETLWQMGSNARQIWNELKPAAPDGEYLLSFREGGYVVMRSGWSSRAHHLIFDTGPLGCRVSGGHGHADLLSLQCSAFGESYLVDAGTYCYTGDSAWRDHFRSSHAHSTVLVDDRSQAQTSGPFSWQRRPTATLRLCTTRPGYCLAEAEHGAYDDLADPVRHRRRVMFVDGHYWVVIDELEGKLAHRIDVNFQLAPRPVAVEADGWARVQGERSALLIKSFCATPLSSQIRSGALDPPRGWLSPNYGQRVPAPVLTFSVHAALPLRIVTVLYPVQDPAVAPPEVWQLVENGTIVCLAIESDTVDTIRINAEKLSLTRKAREGNF